METVAIAEKKPRRFPWISLTILIVIMGILASIAIPAYQDYMKRSNWAKAIAATASLKLAISECLNDSGGKVDACNDFSADQLAKYHAALPSTDKMVESVFVLKNASIRITGAAELGKCVVDFVPKIQKEAGIVNWEPIAQPPGEGGDTLNKCKTYVKGCG